MREIKNILRNTLVLAGIFLLSGVIGAQAASLTVTTTADGGAGSLRQAIIDATTNVEANIVTFSIPTSDPGFNSGANRFTISLTSPLPNIPLAAMTMNNFQPQAITVSSNGTFRVFTLVNSAVVTINNLTISNGFSNNGLGGGIFMGNSSTLTLTGCTVSNNVASGNGGGVYMANSGTLTLIRSTVRNNSAINGGGIFIFDSGTVNLDASTINANTAISGGNGAGIYNGTSGTINGTSSTIDGNAAGGFGGGIYNTATITLTNNTISSNNATRGGGIYNVFTATMQNNLIALNTALAGNDLFGGGALGGNGYSGSFNLIGNADDSAGLASAPNRSGTTANPLNPLLGALQNNGGSTATRALLNGSPAIDKGNSPTLGTDQRGLPRPFDNPLIPNEAGNGADIGAYEVQSNPAANFTISGRVFTSNGTTGLRNATVSLTDPQGVVRTTTTSSFGFYSFDGIVGGTTYRLRVSSRLYRFQPQDVTPSSDLTNVDFTGLE